MASREDLSAHRRKMDEINKDILRLINERAALAAAIEGVKDDLGLSIYDPQRETEMLTGLLEANEGPLSDELVKRLFREIFLISKGHMTEKRQRSLKVSRASQAQDTLIEIKGNVFGGSQGKQIIAGPCAIESEDQMEKVARMLSRLGIRAMRGGAFKPRSSPYSFQGLGEEGLKLLKQMGDKYNLVTVSEVMDASQLELVQQHVDILQVGARNMSNFTLLKAVGQTNKPVLLKRGLCATKEEFLNAAEYIMLRGNSQIILCERGIRTFEQCTRNTLDLSVVPVLKQESHLPVVVDISHAAGRKDILLPLARAALAVGADGIMIEAHPHPDVALSDADQQLDLNELARFHEALRGFLS